MFCYVLGKSQCLQLHRRSKSNECNLCTSAEECVHITSVDLDLAICKFRILLSKGGIELQVAINNMKRAYRQVPVRNDYLKFLVIAIWQLYRRRWVFGILHGPPFDLLFAGCRIAI